jgi:hypothetical protein
LHRKGSYFVFDPGFQSQSRKQLSWLRYCKVFIRISKYCNMTE